MQIISQIIGDSFVRSGGNIMNIDICLPPVDPGNDKFQTIIRIGKIKDFFIIQKYSGGILIHVDVIIGKPDLPLLLFQKCKNPTRRMPCQNGIGIIVDLLYFMSLLFNFPLLSGSGIV